MALAPKFGKESTHRNMLMNCAKNGITGRDKTLRAGYNLRTPDALQIATAVELNCQAFLTNDKQLQPVAELRVLILDELEL
jgi:predicted nucleic acid-binding protein